MCPPSTAIMITTKGQTVSSAVPVSSPRKHLLGLEDHSAEEITRILDNAVGMKNIFTRSVKKVPTLRGKTVCNLFFENSTRTRTSFEIAAKRLSADVVNFNVATSSVSKGESILDTARTIQAMGVDYVVMRHSCPGTPHLLSERLRMSVINAGDGAHEHPTQGLLDIFTIREKKGEIKGLKVAILGDILHSRVARSNIYALLKLGARVSLVGPSTLVPKHFEALGCEVHYDLKSGIEGADVINLLRIQLERQRANLFPSIREYRLLYALSSERLKYAKPDVLVMHPGPVNRGVEITQEVADGPNSVIDEQVTNGIAVRMAVLYLLGGGQGADVAD